MNNTTLTLSARASSPTAGILIGGRRFGDNHPPLVRAIGSDPSWAATARGDNFLRHATLITLNTYEDLGVLLDDPDFVFEVMAVKERLGLPVTREGA